MTWANATRRLRDHWLNRIASKCYRCGQFKSRPSTPCQHCGYDPVPVGYPAHTFDADFGFYPVSY